MVEWLLGQDQSPGAGQASTVATSTTRHGRSSVTASFTTSLAAYAATVPTPAAARSILRTTGARNRVEAALIAAHARTPG